MSKVNQSADDVEKELKEKKREENLRKKKNIN